MSKHRASRIQSPERKCNYQTIFAPNPTDAEKAERAKQLKEKEKGFWRNALKELPIEHIPKNRV